MWYLLPAFYKLFHSHLLYTSSYVLIISITWYVAMPYSILDSTEVCLHLITHIFLYPRHSLNPDPINFLVFIYKFFFKGYFTGIKLVSRILSYNVCLMYNNWSSSDLYFVITCVSFNFNSVACSFELGVPTVPNTDVSSISIIGGQWSPFPSPKGRYAARLIETFAEHSIVSIGSLTRCLVLAYYSRSPHW